MALEIGIYTKDLELTDRIQDYVTKKVGKLERFLSDIGECRVDLSYAKTARNASDRYIAQITIRGKGFILRSEERSDNMFAAIDATVDKMTRQIGRFKGKHWRKRVGEAEPVAVPVVEEVEEEIVPTIVRRKTFNLEPMHEEEALEQLALLGHDEFFVFFNVDNERVNVLYRRRDGNYGLIDPVIK
ncbi:MAG: ribosome-associated translation inhibitor RaiA [Anaerolineaceae bacterium]|jgi:putative sigma-54 modulation protein|nr:ribosome-associated translation inhibitor RaiA [Anaerolineaceae bacterium]MDD4042014.1 ribosome-associated translation inhibitor RaiA [Anaerolineaceae bacterium]MDD4577562.1 ribosome-associated translation inhibitor RaiA [Anaerolineaceae bacterium]